MANRNFSYNVKGIVSTNIKIKSLLRLLNFSEISKIDIDALHSYCEIIVDLSKKIAGYTSNLNQIKFS